MLKSKIRRVVGAMAVVTWLAVSLVAQLGGKSGSCAGREGGGARADKGHADRVDAPKR